MSDAVEKDLPGLIKRRRIASGMNQTRLGKKVGVSPAAISGWETGSRIPRAAVVPDLSAALQIDVETLAQLVIASAR